MTDFLLRLITTVASTGKKLLDIYILLMKVSGRDQNVNVKYSLVAIDIMF